MTSRILCLVTVALLAAGCQTAGKVSAPAAGGNRMLLNAGFTAKTPTTPQQIATYNALPPNAMVKQTIGNKVSYIVSDPAGCGCIYVGGRAAFDNYRAMQNTMQAMTQPAGIDGLGLDGIDDLGTWAPL
ncbi:MAG: hypothetical protein U1E62_24340 [Alsobacter sp.]